ncbi:hypothetical protein DK846_16770 [Methanospirillum lacunae]|uniref:Uncharacterized protein n=1 Tax=Methanospirillum lacunae TaxID=668570 RepID=A0A2V2MR13_9EURY|nr:hypothetical protein DK846_16770 [Methanospirillum lacunae]
MSLFFCRRRSGGITLYSNTRDDKGYFRYLKQNISNPVVPGKNAQMHRDKIFDENQSSQIRGTKTIELPLITNQRRNFVYIH